MLPKGDEEEPESLFAGSEESLGLLEADSLLAVAGDVVHVLRVLLSPPLDVVGAFDPPLTIGED